MSTNSKACKLPMSQMCSNRHPGNLDMLWDSKPLKLRFISFIYTNAQRKTKFIKISVFNVVIPKKEIEFNRLAIFRAFAHESRLLSQIHLHSYVWIKLIESYLRLFIKHSCIDIRFPSSSLIFPFPSLLNREIMQFSNDELSQCKRLKNFTRDQFSFFINDDEVFERWFTKFC